MWFIHIPHPIPAAGTMDSDIVTLFQSFGEVSFEYAEKAGKLVGDILFSR